MNVTMRSSHTPPSILNGKLGLISLMGGLLLLSIMVAEGCVKRPNWEPTTGMSPKVFMAGESSGLYGPVLKDYLKPKLF